MQALYPASPTEVSDDDLIELYGYPTDRRWVRANFVSSVDGAAQGGDQKSGSLSSTADQHVFALLRSLCDVVIAGARTTRVEGYQPVLPSETEQSVRADHGLARVPAIAVVSRSLRIDPALVRGGIAPTIVVTTASAPQAAREQIAERAPVIVAGETSVDFASAIDQLAGHGYKRMLCEGGPTLMRELADSGCLDELCLTVSPRLEGGDRLRIVNGPPLDPPRGLALRHLLEHDGELFFRYTTR